MPDPLAGATVAQDPLAAATAAQDPLAAAQPLTGWQQALGSLTGQAPLLNWLNQRGSNQSILDPSTRLQNAENWVSGKVNGAESSLVNNFSPSALAKEPPGTFSNEGVGGKVKTLGKAYSNLFKDYLATTPRVLSNIAQGAANAVGGIGEFAADKGAGLATMLPGGPSHQDVRDAYNSGAVLSPQDISNATQSLASHLQFSQDPTSVLNAPQTPLGHVSDAALTLGAYALGPELAGSELGIAPGIPQRLATMGGLGTQGFGSIYQAATHAGLPDPMRPAIGAGLTNAFLGGLGYSSAFEPQAGKLLSLLRVPEAATGIASKALVTAPEAALTTAMQGKIQQNFDPSAPTFGGGNFLNNLAMMGGLKIAGGNAAAKQAETFNPTYAFPEGRPAPSPISGNAQAPFDLESQLMNLRSQQMADTAVVNNLTTLFKGVSPEARAELSNFYSDREAGLNPKQPLSPEAQAVVNNPAWQTAMQKFGQRYQSVLDATGQEGTVDPNHIPRVVTEGVDATTGPKGGGAVSQSDASLASPSFYALQDAEGRRVLVTKGAQATPGAGAAMVPIGMKGDYSFAPNPDGTYGPDHMQIKPASIGEIENQTPVRYRKDAISDLLQGVTGMGRVARNIDFINAVKNSPLTFAPEPTPTGPVPTGPKMTLPIEGSSEWQRGEPDSTQLAPAPMAPNGFVPLSSQASAMYPALGDLSMDPRLAQAFEAAAQRGLPPVEPNGTLDALLSKMGNLGPSAVNLGFGINPLAHSGGNMPPHALDAIIKFGALKDPAAATASFAEASNSVNALKAGIADQNMVDFLSSGGSLMSGPKLIQAPRDAEVASLPQSINNQARLQTPQAYDPTAQPGMQNMSDLSTHLTWTPDDTARMGLALFYKKMNEGVSLADAIQEVSKVYPDYRNYMNRTPWAWVNQKLFQINKFTGTNFSNYEMKAAGIVGRNFLDLINPNILGEGGTRLGAALSLGTKASTATLLATMMGSLIQSLTHDPRAEFSGGGTGHLFHQAAQDYRQAGGGIGGVIQTPVTLAAQRIIPNALMNLLLSNMHRGYQGREPVNPTDSQDAWLNLRSMLDPALRGDLDQAKQAMDNGALSDATRHMGNLLENYATSTANQVLYNGGNLANLGSQKTDAASVLSHAFLRATRGGTDAEQATDFLSSMRASRFPPNANQVSRAEAKKAYANALHDQDWPAADQIAGNGNLSGSDLSKLQTLYGNGDRIQTLAAKVGTLPYADAVRVFANGTTDEKNALFPIVSDKLDRAYDKLGGDAQMPTDPAAITQMFSSGPFAQFYESQRLFNAASASMPKGAMQAPDPLAGANPVAPSSSSK